MTKQQITINIPREYEPLFKNNWRECAIYGGRFSLKSHTVARYLLIQARMKQQRIGCFREFQNSISESSHQLLSDLINQYELHDFEITDKSIVNKITGSDFIFKGLHHNEQSIKSIEGIDIAWVEEAQTISEKSIEILTPTVRKEGSKLIYTYNRLTETDPIHKRLVIEGRPNSLILNLNYDIALKYGYMPDVIKHEMEDDRENRPALYKHKWLGEPQSHELKIYKDWNFIDEIPFEARLECYGLDFGYTNDPTAITAIYKYNGGFILDEITYSKGLTNERIAKILLNLPQALVMADSAEPKSIDEIRIYGVNILPVEKGAGSVLQGIQYVQSQKISVTRRSFNLTLEYHNYIWKRDKDNRVTNIPEQGYDHMCFTEDTKIETLNGEVIYKQYTGKKDVYEFMGSKVTADHPYLTQRGFVRLDALRYCDNIVIWKNKSLMEYHLDDTQNLKRVQIETILYLLQRNLQAIKLNIYTGIYGKNTMVKYQKAFIYTIKTIIQSIMMYLISNVYHLRSIRGNIIKICYQSGKKICKLHVKELVIGLKQKKVKNYVLNGVKKMLNIFQDMKLQETVINVEKSIPVKSQKESSATIIAKLRHLGQEDVYATSTNNGVFLANGVVVSNCDAVRYGFNSIRPRSEITESKLAEQFNKNFHRQNLNSTK